MSRENPQLEDGYTKIVNSVLEELSKMYLSNQEARIIYCVWRKTYGWGRKEDPIPLSQFVELTHLGRSNVCKTLKRLVAKQLLAKTEKGYMFNKKHSQWITKGVVAKQPLGGGVVAKQPLGGSGQTATSKGKGVVAKQPPSKDNPESYKERGERKGDSSLPLILTNQWRAKNHEFAAAYPKMIPRVMAEISAALARGMPSPEIEQIIWNTAGQGLKPWELFKPKQQTIKEVADSWEPPTRQNSKLN